MPYSTTTSTAPERDVYFLVSHNDTNYKCKGDDLYDKVDALDKLVVSRSSTVGTVVPADLEDSDLLVCMDGNQLKKITGDKVKQLFEDPPPLAPLLTQLDNVVKNDGDAVETPLPNTEVTVEVQTNSESDHLTKTYNWTIAANGSDASFTSSANARIATIDVGTVGLAIIRCTVDAVGSADGPVNSAVIQIRPT